MRLKIKNSSNNFKIPLKISGIYFLFSFLWILFSDKLLLKITDDATFITEIQTIKGLVFILASALIIFFLIHREISAKNEIIATIKLSGTWNELLFSNLTGSSFFLLNQQMQILLAKGPEIKKMKFDSLFLQGKSIQQLDVFERDKKTIMNNLKKVLKGRKLEREIYIYGNWYLMQGMPIQTNEKEIIAALFQFSNITQRKINELELLEAKKHAEESDRLKSAFLANMSHEIRTPLNGLIGFSELLAMPELKPAQRKKYIEFIKLSGKQLIGLINDLLDISRIEVNQLKVSKSMFSINDMLEKIHLLYAENPKVKNKNIQLKLYKELKNGDDILYSDKVRINQVLINFLNNAFKFTKTGKIEFGYQLNEASNSCVFFVKDTGIGIPQEKHIHIFERFKQAHDNKEMINEGVGLGLAISKGIINSLNGTIWFESNINKGSSFYFSLPHNLRKPQNQNRISAFITSEKIEYKNILLLNPSSDTQIIKDFCKENKISIINHFSVNEAITDCINNEEIELAIIEHQDKILNGIEIVKTIKQFNPIIRIVLLINEGQLTNLKEFDNLLLDGFLQKPFTLPEFKSILQKKR